MSDKDSVLLSRPLKRLYEALANWTGNDMYLELTLDEFVGKIMRDTHGSNSPSTVRAVCRALHEEAGVKPLFPKPNKE